ncbi:unnamed protein product [Dicrocoelium dendriticum]|nr:unnamed protein product [Dicrocoelium dendriticum]
MGGSFGKFTLPTVEDRIKADTASEPPRAEPAKETASQPDSWKESSHIQPTTDPAAKSTPNGDQSVANGTLGSTDSATETDHGKKKNKNPLGWIKRRLSKKSSETNPPTTDQAAVPEGVQTPVHERPEDSLAVPDTQTSSDQTPEKQAEITEVAISLVDDVLLSAITAQTEEAVENSPKAEGTSAESQVPPEQPVEHQPSTDTAPEHTPHQEIEPALSEPPPEVQSCSLNGDHRDDEAVDKSVDMDHSCTDMEERPRTTEAQSNVNHPDDEAVTTKLGGMELTNGHPHELTNVHADFLSSNPETSLSPCLETTSFSFPKPQSTVLDWLPPRLAIVLLGPPPRSLRRFISDFSS